LGHPYTIFSYVFSNYFPKSFLAPLIDVLGMSCEPTCPN
jgi:hypothetical protein